MRGVTLPTLGALFGIASVGHVAQALDDLEVETPVVVAEPEVLHDAVREAGVARMMTAEAAATPPASPEDRLAALYAAMPTDRAARLLAGLEAEQAAAVLRGMPTRQAGRVLGIMPSGRAAAVAQALAEREGA